MGEPVAWTLSNLEGGKVDTPGDSTLLCYAYVFDRSIVNPYALAGCNVTMANKRIDFACFVRCFAFLCSFDFLRSREINSGGETFELPNLSNRKGIFVVRALA